MSWKIMFDGNGSVQPFSIRDAITASTLSCSMCAKLPGEHLLRIEKPYRILSILPMSYKCINI
ncbi:hypothetical protein D3C80_1873490 [compost metagenome]